MSGLLVTDLDGSLVPRGGDRIPSGVAQALRELGRTHVILVVSSRASPKAMNAAAVSMRHAGLEHMPMRFRDWTRFDQSADQRVAAKVEAIRDFAREDGCEPRVGIGDEATDVAAYELLGMKAFRLVHEGECASGSAGRTIIVARNDLAVSWSALRQLVDSM